MASKLIKFCIINHHILRWKTTIEIGKEGNHLGQLSGGDTSSKGENCSCSATGNVTSNGALTISVVAVSVSGVGSVVASIFLELSVSWGSASRVCSNIGRSLPGSPWSIMKLTNTRRPLKGKHNRNDNETKKRVRIGYCFAKVLFFLWTKIYQHHGSAYLPFVGREEQWQMRVLPFLKTVREKGIQRRVKWWLLRPSNLDCGEVGFCDTTARYCRATTGVTLRLHTAF